jgi:multidrug efflux system membrane fusion protein
MTIRRIGWSVALLLVLLVIGFTSLHFGRGAPSSEIQSEVATKSDNKISVVEGRTRISVSTEAQKASGIVTALVATTSHALESTAYGVVVDVSPLVEMQGRYLTAKADLASAQAAALASDSQLKRSENLFADDENVSRRALDVARVTAASDESRVAAARANFAGIRALAEQQFGEKIGASLAEASVPYLRRLVERKDVLIRVTLPAADFPQYMGAFVSTPDGQRFPATFLSASPVANPGQLGDAFYFLVSKPIGSGARVEVSLPKQPHGVDGVVVPGSAIVWYGGQAWAYVGVSDTDFERTLVSTSDPLGDGFFVQEGFEPDAKIVVQGAQLLLSDEFHQVNSSSDTD